MPARKDPETIRVKVSRMRDLSKPLPNEPCAVQHLTGEQWATLLAGTPAKSVSEAFRNAIEELRKLRLEKLGGTPFVNTDERSAEELKRRGWVVLTPDEAVRLARDAADAITTEAERLLLSHIRPRPRT